MQGDIITQGLELMLYGMGTVVVFLTLLVLATTLMSRLVTRFFPEAAAEEAVTGTVAPAAPVAQDSQIVAVIAAAIRKHRSRNGD